VAGGRIADELVDVDVRRTQLVALEVLDLRLVPGVHGVEHREDGQLERPEGRPDPNAAVAIGLAAVALDGGQRGQEGLPRPGVLPAQRRVGPQAVLPFHRHAGGQRLVEFDVRARERRRPDHRLDRVPGADAGHEDPDRGREDRDHQPGQGDSTDPHRRSGPARSVPMWVGNARPHLVLG
jgi:hypothetical protein